MKYDTQGHEFDIHVQRFISNRWETDLGRKVLDAVIRGFKDGVEVRAILDPHVLNDPALFDEYAHPVYPAHRLGKDEFWLLNSDDLRGIHFYNEDFSNSPSIEIKRLDYARFSNCNFRGANLERCSFTRMRATGCDFTDAVMAMSGGFYTIFQDCDLTRCCFWESGFIEPDFVGSNLTHAYFEDAKIIAPIVDYRTKFGNQIALTWATRTLPEAQLPDIYRMIRIAYQQAELYQISDLFLYKERTAFRAQILAPRADASARLRMEWLAVGIGDWDTGPSHFEFWVSDR